MKSGWNIERLGDIITLKRGYDLPEYERTSGDVPIVTSSGVTGYHDTAKAPGPGVVTGRYGTLGKVYYIKEDFWPHNTTLYVKDFKGNDPRYISYFLMTLGFGLRNVAAAVPGVNRNDLHTLKVSIPFLPTQQRIASILSAYDDLIENNTRRIKILEEMAKLIYREWFVEFKAPGVKLRKATIEEKKVTGKDQFPEGWEVKNFGDIFSVKYGKMLPISKILESGKYPVYGAGDVIGYYDEKLFDEKVALVTCRGNGSGTVWRTREPAFITNNSFTVVGKNDKAFL